MTGVTTASRSRQRAGGACQGAVRDRRSADAAAHARPVAVAVGATWSPCGEWSIAMADLAYALLLIGVFALLALTVRGLERL
ncbi:hypothetical protein [Umezawaea sp.]|uniref:hypothetical protein n=1 Tax=Umezawaea sp. TaxID=1955258 RepID=UPI002ED613C0